MLFTMKKYWPLALFFAFVALSALPSCAPKSGCPANESLKPRTNRKGEVVGSKRHKDDLFPKHIRKKM